VTFTSPGRKVPQAALWSCGENIDAVRRARDKALMVLNTAVRAFGKRRSNGSVIGHRQSPCSL
jgi:hypothetical protein